MGCSSSSLEQHEWEPQREDHRGDDHARQDLILTGLILLLTLSRSSDGLLFWLSLVVEEPASLGRSMVPLVK